MGITANMKAGIYSPYWDTLGGGEYYAANVARSLRDIGFDVEIFSKDSKVISKLENRFNINLNSITQNKNGSEMFSDRIVNKFKKMRAYETIFVVSDGSIPILLSKNNIIHFQVPFKDVGGNRLSNQVKLKTNYKVVCNSKFTKKYIDQEFGIDSMVIYPAVGQNQIDPIKPKENIILSVGRFDNLMQSKRQDVLIEAFKESNLNNWKLVLAGGVLHGQGYVNKLKRLSQGQNIEIKINISHLELKNLYQTSKVFWHAAGYGLDIDTYPQKAEHFGISTVEAMSAGLVPVVFNGGGLREIITNKTGYLWKTKKELLENTKKAISISKDKQNIDRIIKRSKEFSIERFDEEIKKLVS